jgi:tetratricopeptide (TPR) repeat protein
MAGTLQEMGRFADAVPWYQKHVALIPSAAGSHYRMAVCYAETQRPDDALREIEAALLLEPKLSDARVLRSAIREKRRDHDGAVADLRAAVATDPAKPILRYKLARLLAAAQRTAEAEAAFAELLKLRPDFAAAYAGLGAIHAGQGRLPEAVAEYRKALELEPLLDDARFNLAEVLEGQQRLPEALAEYRRLAAADAARPEVRQAAEVRLAALGAGQ